MTNGLRTRFSNDDPDQTKGLRPLGGTDEHLSALLADLLIGAETE